MLGKLVRTIKRLSAKINIGKWNLLSATIKAYNKEKQYWLSKLQQIENILHINRYRDFRDQIVLSGYVSSYGLQARQWKMALNDACEMMNKYWLSVIDKVRVAVYSNTELSDTQRHYANYILQNNFSLYDRLSNLFRKQLIEFNHDIDTFAKREVIKYLLRKFKQLKGKYPKIKLARSMTLDANMYDVLDINGKQCLSIMSLNKGERIRIPLLGNTQGVSIGNNKSQFGNIKIVVTDQKIEMHYCVESSKQVSQTTQAIIGVDLGYSEVFVDNHGKSYGKTFGQVLQTKSDELKTKNQTRNKLRSLVKKYLSINNFKKANNLLKFNLGKTKYNSLINKQNATTQRIVNQAINELHNKHITTNQAVTLVTEKLTTPISKKLGKNWNRRLSAWIKGFITERIEFKALAKGFSHKTVNAAYTSQTCPIVPDYMT